MMRFKDSMRVAGVVLVIPKSSPPQGFSPHNSCPNQGTGESCGAVVMAGLNVVNSWQM